MLRMFMQGLYEIISRLGSFLLSEDNGTHIRSSGSSVTLAGSYGRILGGAIVGVLIAATACAGRDQLNFYLLSIPCSIRTFHSFRWQVLQGSFIAGVKKPKPDPGGTSSESPDDPRIPANNTGGIAQNNFVAAFPFLILPCSATDTRYEITDTKLITLCFSILVNKIATLAAP